VRARKAVLEWLFWQMAGIGPMSGQNNHFANYAPEKLPYAIERYRNETNRLYGVLDNQLGQTGAFVAGADYSIADMAIYPWVVLADRLGQDLNDFPDVKKWIDTIRERPATKRAYANGEAERYKQPVITEESRKILFGQTAQHVRRA
jgi:GST-like protein